MKNMSISFKNYTQLDIKDIVKSVEVGESDCGFIRSVTIRFHHYVLDNCEWKSLKRTEEGIVFPLYISGVGMIEVVDNTTKFINYLENCMTTVQYTQITKMLNIEKLYILESKCSEIAKRSVI